MGKGITLSKITDSIPNEDSYFCNEDFVAISDGAGGCGVFSDKWSNYIVNKLPVKSPIKNFRDFDKWFDSICDNFYISYEEKAKKVDPMFLKKFYQEGSYATIAAIWRVSGSECRYIAYGDSVIFHYNYDTKELKHSFTKLEDFSNPPYLVNYIEPLNETAFSAGSFPLNNSSIVFAATDSLSHYILMMYMLSHREHYADQINDILNKKLPNSQLLSIALTQQINYNDIINELISSIDNEKTFETLIKRLYSQGIIDTDDYTIVVL